MDATQANLFFDGQVIPGQVEAGAGIGGVANDVDGEGLQGEGQVCRSVAAG